MPTATTTREDSLSKMAQNHPHDFTKRLFKSAFFNCSFRSHVVAAAPAACAGVRNTARAVQVDRSVNVTEIGRFCTSEVADRRQNQGQNDGGSDHRSATARASSRLVGPWPYPVERNRRGRSLRGRLRWPRGWRLRPRREHAPNPASARRPASSSISPLRQEGYREDHNQQNGHAGERNAPVRSSGII